MDDEWCQEGEADVYLGRVDANYLSRARGLSDCNAIAVAEANRRDVDAGDWSYVCWRIGHITPYPGHASPTPQRLLR